MIISTKEQVQAQIRDLTYQKSMLEEQIRALTNYLAGYEQAEKVLTKIGEQQ